MKCTCGPNEACSSCPKSTTSATGDVTWKLGPPAPPAPLTVEDVRYELLRQINKWAGTPDKANDVRNWATAYGILTDKAIAEKSVKQYTDATGGLITLDAFGNRVDL